ncbi:MAG: hypothetical protein AAGD01_04205 [Acidobacteriota bacterium]
MRSRYAVVRKVSNDHLVRVRDRSRRRELLQILCAVAPLGLGLMAYIWTHVAVLTEGYAINALEREVHALVQQQRALELQIAAAAAPPAVESRAREHLAMEAPRPRQLIFLEHETLAERWPVGEGVAARPRLQSQQASQQRAAGLPREGGR